MNPSSKLIPPKYKPGDMVIYTGSRFKGMISVIQAESGYEDTNYYTMVDISPFDIDAIGEWNIELYQPAIFI